MPFSAGLRGAVLALAVVATVGQPAAGSAAQPDSQADARARHWTAQRRAAAVPRDLVVDERGRGFLRLRNGGLESYGKGAEQPADTSGPSVTNVDPSAGSTIAGAHTFKATVTDPDGVKSVSFSVGRIGGSYQNFNARHAGSGVWTVSLQGFSNGDWRWYVRAKDGAKRGGNTTTTDPVAFSVDTDSSGGGGGTDPEIVANSEWTGGGAVQTAIGRVYFEMPANKSHTRWVGYVCSGTVAQDATSDRSVVITAAHCVYDDVNGAFARNVLFIPNQAGTSGSGTDRDCGNDPLGCWAPSHGVVDVNWTNRTWPSNIPWDYAYYVVPDDAHTGAGTGGALDSRVDALSIQFTAPSLDGSTHALGYSFNEDPKLMYCAEGLATENSYGDWWLGSCGLSGGASGGPWVQPLTGGSGPIISVNSWGYSNQPGMAGPRLHDTSAHCVFTAAASSTADLIKTC
ncbi:MAG: hypothetical protein GEU74_13240 [Nitriliruptorales bacterium]|nr:hypothetical protein [Nitriliruptorales bacterium]